MICQHYLNLAIIVILEINRTLCIYAAKILPVVQNQHLLLCTLLIANAAAMEVTPPWKNKEKREEKKGVAKAYDRHF